MVVSTQWAGWRSTPAPARVLTVMLLVREVSPELLMIAVVHFRNKVVAIERDDQVIASLEIVVAVGAEHPHHLLANLRADIHGSGGRPLDTRRSCAVLLRPCRAVGQLLP